MTEPLSVQVLSQLDAVQDLYYRLVIIVGPSGSGKTRTLREIERQTGTPLVNVNLELSAQLLDLSRRKRALAVSRALDELVGSEQELVLLDNTEVLFDICLEQDPLRLLRGMSRSRTVVASWNGTVDRGYLFYAGSDHPEYRRYGARDLSLVCAEAAS